MNRQQKHSRFSQPHLLSHTQRGKTVKYVFKKAITVIFPVRSIKSTMLIAITTIDPQVLCLDVVIEA